MNALRANYKAVFLFTFPALAVFTVIVVYPLIQIFYRSMFDWDGITEGTFVFLDNYKNLLHDSLFYTSLKNGLLFAGILTVFQLGIGTILALALMNKRMVGRNLLRRVYFLPVVLSVSVVCQLWISMYNPMFGLFNKIFEFLHLSYRQDWLSSPGISSIIAVTIVSSWQYLGYQFALIYAGAKSIPEQYFEAAKIDGASTWVTHRKITIPMLAETYKMCLIFALVGGLNAFAHMQIMTKGGPGTATYTLTYLMYRSAFVVNDFGYGCAVAVSLVLECLLVTIVVNRLVARDKITY
ncbi:sugar ABC transporter permease [Paenibacillus pectinilyticus]|uniref:Sugar ABC transporter permease n=1 Tax=Paenibacillus pectinilyticus TaxID=512399 RepID=A0A1C1A4M9_9BACL|nr:sugar ABC transporter permease [Paenibacillus pectinilyticus]OCT15498.1 sugar ABC transporter permease [Paenibacillus pectinilyticus]